MLRCVAALGVHGQRSVLRAAVKSKSGATDACVPVPVSLSENKLVSSGHPVQPVGKPLLRHHRPVRSQGKSIATRYVLTREETYAQVAVTKNDPMPNIAWFVLGQCRGGLKLRA
jgi:hypothetical protein